jgi:aspartyl/asparaginyl beta-hydroxylase (cupin superfamily)
VSNADLTEQMEALDAQALRAMQARDFASARRFLQQLAELDASNVDQWLKLAAVCRAMGDLNAAMLAIDKGLEHNPRSYVALLMRATVLEKMGNPTAAVAFGNALSQVPPSDDMLDGPTLAATKHAREVYQKHVSDLRKFLADKVEAENPNATALERKKLTWFLDDSLRLRKRYQQEPAQFYYPHLPHIEFFERDLFPWLEAFEAQTPVILEELMGVIDKDFTGFTPYVEYDPHLPLDQWKELNHNPDWGAFHMLKGGKRIAGNADRCPRTMEAVSKLPQPNINNRGPTAMFSCLQPHTVIPPHTGVSNTRLLVHLPLIIPDSCGFRVGNETREWKLGEAWVFDDSVNHEAWNNSDQFRIIMIVDIWNPFLSPAEQVAIKAAMEAMDEFGGMKPTADG